MINISDNTNYQIDIFLKVTNQNNKTAYEIIEEHIEVTKNNPQGYTWWGNNQPYSPEKVKEFQLKGHNPKALIVIPHTSGGSDNIEYIADIVDSIKDNNTCFPNDNRRPQYYMNEKHKVWLKLSNFRKINVNRDKVDIGQYYLISNDDSLLQKMQSRYACGYVYKYIIDDETFENEQYQRLIQQAISSKTEEIPQPIPNSKLTGVGKIWERNPKTAKEALEIANYSCEINNTHITFTSQKTGENFVEAHHLAPMKQQENFPNSIDVPANIISLCPNCHRAIHLAAYSEKEKMIKDLYNKRRLKLNKYNINITIDELLLMYK